MRLAVLFWFYKAFDVCAQRLASLRQLNPESPIYALYGGPADRADEAQRLLGGLCDDLYVYPGNEDPYWKWLNGDQLIAAWARERGVTLEWDTVVVVQWDMLILEPLSAMLADLQAGEALFSGFRSLDEVSAWWGWAGAHDPEKRALLLQFREFLRGTYRYEGPVWCCLFIMVCLPRAFLSRYAAIQPPAPGFLEYKMPTLAKVWGAPVRRAPDPQPWWAADPATKNAAASARVLNAVGEEVSAETIVRELMKELGARVFHPVSSAWPPT
jgi:hypothetical protein